MITTGAELTTFVTGLNADADIDATLLDVLVDNAKTVLEAERPWVALRRTDVSLSLVYGENAAVTMSISDFANFNGDTPIKLYDGDNRIDYYRQVPFDRRLEYKDVSNTFCYDKYNDLLYFNGIVAFAGTLYINYVASTAAVDLAAKTAVWSQFPPRFLPILGYYAIGINKGAIDYDSINRQMLPGNDVVLEALRKAMYTWDDNLQQSEMAHNDPTEFFGGHRDGAVTRNN